MGSHLISVVYKRGPAQKVKKERHGMTSRDAQRIWKKDLAKAGRGRGDKDLVKRKITGEKKKGGWEKNTR